MSLHVSCFLRVSHNFHCVNLEDKTQMLDLLKKHRTPTPPHSQKLGLMFLLVILSFSHDHIPSIFGKGTQQAVCQPAVILSVLFTCKVVCELHHSGHSQQPPLFYFIICLETSSKHTTLKNCMSCLFSLNYAPIHIPARKQ